MSAKSAAPRQARMTGIRASDRATLVAGRIFDGPQSEIGKTVHVTVRAEDLPLLKRLVAFIEDSTPAFNVDPTPAGEGPPWEWPEDDKR